MKTQKGFTLIELLIVIGIIAILMAIAIVAINPGRQFAKANNAKRWGDVGAIADAISLRIIENRGDWGVDCDALPTTATTARYISSAATATSIDICACLVTDYFGIMPTDPTEGSWGGTCSTYDTGYTLEGLGGGRIKIEAPTIDDEGPSTPTEISVSR